MNYLIVSDLNTYISIVKTNTKVNKLYNTNVQDLIMSILKIKNIFN